MKQNVINIREIREEKGLTQKELADKLGVSLRTYQRYETNNGRLDYKKLLEISKQLGVSMDKLMGSSINIGSGNIAVSGSGNQIAGYKTTKTSSPKFKEFLDLYERYGNEVILDGFIKKLNALKEISEG
ncbi:helix-turn-helix domain-containing protein [Campylobacter sp. RM16187]|uniref:helix-turn-helix domain-containing protein n=1 Tax=Campylobacter sp. RM16187 TaxID=1660063 RepID=UPI0021B54B08|nr:helix-turn-helix transcriptional regulator [Campylobacter sp. RM16187]QKG29214.1 helix-turn-helix domain protein [Campylobacter sp. RM16187]